MFLYFPRLRTSIKRGRVNSQYPFGRLKATGYSNQRRHRYALHRFFFPTQRTDGVCFQIFFTVKNLKQSVTRSGSIIAYNNFVLFFEYVLRLRYYRYDVIETVLAAAAVSVQFKCV